MANSANCNLPYIISTYVQMSKNTAEPEQPRIITPAAFVSAKVFHYANGGRAWIRTRDPALIKRML